MLSSCSKAVPSSAYSYHAGTSTSCENVAQVLIFRRDTSEEVLNLLERLSKPDGEPKLHILNSLPQRILPCDWDQLVLDPNHDPVEK